MKRLVALAFAWLLALAAPAHAVALLNNQTITGPLTGVTPGPTLQLRPGPGGVSSPVAVGILANFIYGSGGTTANVYVQTSLDGGQTWCDVAVFAFTTTSTKSLINISSAVAVATAAPCTDGTGSAGSINVVGSQWRAKLTTTGTYAGGTNVSIDLITNGLTQ